MKRLFVLILFLLMANTVRAEDVKDSAAWWLKSYGGVTAQDEPLVERAERIFEKVAAAADKNGKRFPRLLVINYAHDPFAASIRDGSIILTLGGLKLCYSGVNRERGDSRLAFLLGHELSHSAQDDYWHSAALAAVKGFAEGGPEARTALLTYLRESAGEGKLERVRETNRVKELQADSYGLLYMAMAGYDPKGVVDRDGTNFFHDWVTQISGNSSFDGDGYPKPQERAEFFRIQLAAVANELDLFTFGVRLCQIGNYEEALLLLDRFREKFPSRELFSNIGLAWYQLAMRDLAVCDPDAPLRFKLPTIIDDRTLAGGFRAKGAGSACLENESYRRRLTSAIRYLEMAVSKDQQYIPARVNLASAYIMAGEYSKSMAESDVVLKVAPDNPHAVNAKALSLYLFGRSGNIDTTDTALRMFRESAAKNPVMSDLIYNQAAISSERGREAAARDGWKAFVAMESTSPFAKAARKRLGIADKAETPPSRMVEVKSPVGLGEIKGESAKLLKRATKRSFSIGRTNVDMYEMKWIRVLAINGSVELVEAVSDKPSDLAEFKSEHDGPFRVVTTTSGSTLVYRNMAADVRGGSVEKVVYFEDGGRPGR